MRTQSQTPALCSKLHNVPGRCCTEQVPDNWSMKGRVAPGSQGGQEGSGKARGVRAGPRDTAAPGANAGTV